MRATCTELFVMNLYTNNMEQLPEYGMQARLRLTLSSIRALHCMHTHPHIHNTLHVNMTAELNLPLSKYIEILTFK